MNDNEFTGSLPTEIGSMGKLQIVYVADNKFTGTFPPEWKKLSKMCKWFGSAHVFRYQFCFT